MSMVTIHIDDRPYTAKGGENLLQECLSLGFDLPYFCWHPAMGSVGACRQCAIKQFRDREDTRGRIVMACMTPATDGTRISIDDQEARDFRAEVIEWLMTVHPHDCPVCDEGGECHLQDMTLMTGHTYRRYDGRKRTYRNQDLGPLVNHEMNRCIQCYRCVRFYRHYAGGMDFDALLLRNQVYFGRYQDGPLENEFSGNLVEVCPTGVFTDKTLSRHYTRKWDLQTAPSICMHCGSGCNTIPGERYGTLRRVHNRYNSEVNGYFLCDRGRYGYEFVNSEHRIRRPLLRKETIQSPIPHPEDYPQGGKTTIAPSPFKGMRAGFRNACVAPIESSPLASGDVGRRGWGWVSKAIGAVFETHPHPNPPLEGEGIPRSCQLVGNDQPPHQRESVRSGPELLTPDPGRVNTSASPQPVDKQEALSCLAELFSSGARVIGIGSPRASIEANFALRALVGREQFHLGMSDRESYLTSAMIDILRKGPARTPSLHEVELADAVLILGEDVTNTAPRLALALRQSVRQQPLRKAEKMHIPHWDDNALRHATQQEKGPLFIAALAGTKLDEVATQTFQGAPDDLARLGFAVAHALDAQAPAVSDLPETMRTLADAIAQALKTAERPLVVSGTSCGSEAVIRAAANVAWALCNSNHHAGLCYTVPECNSMGTALMGGHTLGTAFQLVQEGIVDGVVILENDLYRRADALAVDAFFSSLHATARRVVVIDHVTHATSAQADIVLPAGTFAEADGTLVSNEGRAQRFFQVFVPEGDIQESWRWVRDIATATGCGKKECQWTNLDQLMAACAAEIPALGPIVDAAPPANFRLEGQKIPRETHRYSGRTAIRANLNVHERQPPPADPDAPLAFSMEGYPGQPPPPLIPVFWAPRWNSREALNKFQDEVGGPLRGGAPGVRLIEPMQTGQGQAGYFTDIPAAFAPRPREQLLVPLYHIFGSDELSVLAPGIAQLSDQAYLALHPADAEELGWHAGDEAKLRVGRTTYRLPVRLRPDLLRGMAGLPAGLPDLKGMMLPAWGEIARKAAS